MPFCASGTMATVVVLARHSAPEWVRLAVPTTQDAERASACCSNGTGGLPRLLLLLRTEPGTSGLGGERASPLVTGSCGRSATSRVRTDSQPDRPGSDVEVEPHGHLPLRR